MPKSYQPPASARLRICYVLLSPTFGMHQYTADLANRMVAAGHEVHLVTTAGFPRDRYSSRITFHMPVTTRNTGFSLEGLRFGEARRAEQVVRGLRPDAVHFTGPHLWNVSLVRALRRAGIPVIHTIHDLDPHAGSRYGPLLHLWNAQVIHSAGHIMVHAEGYRQRLVAAGLAPENVTYTPLLHLFLGHTRLAAVSDAAPAAYEPWALFFGRLEAYKGVDFLLAASAMMGCDGVDGPRVVVAGPGRLDRLWAGPLPPCIELRNRMIQDDEAIDLFRRCGVLVLPYVDASQSSLVAAAYFFRKPVVVTRTGALPEYVEDGRTGFVVEPAHASSLARCLQELLCDPARMAAMGAAGRAWYERQRIEETIALFAMYERVRDVPAPG